MLGSKSTFVLRAAQSSFVAQNPKAYAAYLDSLGEAMQLINADKPKYAELYLRLSKSKEELGSVLALMNDNDIEFATTPLNLAKVVEFLVETGTVKDRPSSWKQLTFPNLHTSHGS